MTRLCLGCGGRYLDGYVNIDIEKRSRADLVMDLEQFPWPFADGEVEEVEASHVMEHLRDFVGVMKELYRVMAPDAILRITVPHHRSDGFAGDPTHRTMVTYATLELFSRAKNHEWAEKKWPNTPLALYHDIDFRIESVTFDLMPEWKAKGLTGANLDYCISAYNNVVSECRFVLRRV